MQSCLLTKTQNGFQKLDSRFNMPAWIGYSNPHNMHPQQFYKNNNSSIIGLLAPSDTSSYASYKTFYV